MNHFLLLFGWIFMGIIAAYFAKANGKNPYLWFFLGALFGLFGIFFLFFSTAAAKRREAAETKEIALHPSCPSSYKEKLWFYLTPDNQQQGPISYTSLLEKIQTGIITPTLYLWNEELENWRPCRELFELHSE